MNKQSRGEPCVYQLDPGKAKKLLKAIHSKDFEITAPQYTEFQAKKKGLSVTLYTSGKLVVQGAEKEEFIQFFLEPEILETFTSGAPIIDPDFIPHIGVDEAGKGDFFGPLSIAGVYAGHEELKTLLELGVKDSKTLSDASIHKLAEKIRRAVPYHIVRIGPEKYNQIYPKFGNLNLLLAWGHATVIENLTLKTGCQEVLIDQFSHHPIVERALQKKSVHVAFEKKTKGESDPIVAAASILARDAFVKGLENLESTLGVRLPKGASKAVLEAGKTLFEKGGKSLLEKVAKTHFKTYDEVLKSFGEKR